MSLCKMELGVIVKGTTYSNNGLLAIPSVPSYLDNQSEWERLILITWIATYSILFDVLLCFIFFIIFPWFQQLFKTSNPSFWILFRIAC